MLLLAAIGGTYFAIKQVATNKAIDFLCNKYSFEKSDIELLDYEQGHKTIYTVDNASFVPDFVKTYSDYKWEFKTNNRTFFVNQVDGLLYDDYQLEDIEKWATKWLKENIDKNIVGIGYSTRNIFEYQKSLGIDGNKYIFSEKNIYDFMNNYNSYKNDYIHIYFYSSQISNEEKETNQNRLKKILSEKLPNSPDVLVYCSSTPKIKISYNDADSNWYGFEKLFEWNRKYFIHQSWLL